MVFWMKSLIQNGIKQAKKASGMNHFRTNITTWIKGQHHLMIRTLFFFFIVRFMCDVPSRPQTHIQEPINKK